MVVMTESWNEQRLDDLNGRVEGVRREVHELRGEMHEGFVQVRAEIKAGDDALRKEIKAGDDALRAEMKAGFAEMNARFDTLQQTIIQVGGGLIGTMIVASAALVATQL